MKKYQCIECGSAVESLYHDYKAGVIKISHCTSCNAVADKYIEYDQVIIFLDALLLQRQAYRHLLINTKFDSHWRLAVLLSVCDAFTKLVLQRAEMMKKHSSTEPVNYTYIGLELYFNFIIAVTELLTLLAAVLIMYSLKAVWQHRRLKPTSTHLIIKAVIVASMGRVLAIPALLWGQSYSHVYLWLCQLFVCLSAFQALRVVTEDKHKTLWAAIVVVISFSIQIWVASHINYWLGQGIS